MARRAAACGTVSGYNRHRIHGEIPCPACVAAERMRNRRRVLRTGQRRDPRRCPDCGSVFAGHACTMDRQPA
jgi:hypothetical protein